MNSLTPEQVDALLYDWSFWARPNQLPPPGNWRTWLLLAGRGFGKTRTGAEYVKLCVKAGYKRIALVGPTAADVRDVMVEGESGIMAVFSDAERPRYSPATRRLTFPNGAIATTYSAEEPERLRGPQSDLSWCDEIASWRYPETWDMLMFGLRLGRDPRVVVTTTPKPIDILIGSGRDGHRLGLLNDPTCIITRGSTYDNAANLANAFLAQTIKRYEGTRLGRQELNAEILDDVQGALWTRDIIEAARISLNPHTGARPKLPDFSRIVVAIDPAVSAGEDSDETGIIVAAKGRDGHGYVLDDRSGRMMPIEWARAAVAAFKDHGADRIVAEVNQGGDMVEATVRMIDNNVPYSGVRATRGKVVRAEPVAALYEQGRVHHVGTFPKLEDQMTSFSGAFDRQSAGYSPDRVDALVWALTELMVEQMDGEGIYEATRQMAIAAAVPPPSNKPVPIPARGSQEWFDRYGR